MKTTVFSGYDQAELDAQYDQRVWAPNQTEICGGFDQLSDATRRTLRFDEYAYGSGDKQRLDWFGTPGTTRGIVVFVHGGAWRAGSRAMYAFPAPAMHANNLDFVALGFDAVPAVTLRTQAEQVATGVVWVCENAARLTGAELPIILAGHSSGAHLAALALTDPRVAAQPAIRRAVCISGSYDLHAVRLSSRNTYLRLEAEDVDALSPLRRVTHSKVPVAIARGEFESAEFARQSDAFRDALRDAGRVGDYLVVDGLNHFEMMGLLSEPDGWLARTLLEAT